MPWTIKCGDTNCGCEARASNIVDLIKTHRAVEGLFRSKCGKLGYVEKSFGLQEEGETWEPYLRGLLPLGNPDETYQPFVFLVSYEPSGPISDVWFSYYKDLRSSGGILKLGYGPGGPPVLGTSQLIDLLEKLVTIRCLVQQDIERLRNIAA